MRINALQPPWATSAFGQAGNRALWPARLNAKRSAQRSERL